MFLAPSVTEWCFSYFALIIRSVNCKRTTEMCRSLISLFQQNLNKTFKNVRMIVG